MLSRFQHRGLARRIRAEQDNQAIRRKPLVLDRAELLNIKLQKTHATITIPGCQYRAITITAPHEQRTTKADMQQ
jgi:hypothetical protein